jgi:glycolate oxidase subunit GlcD
LILLSNPFTKQNLIITFFIKVIIGHPLLSTLSDLKSHYNTYTENIYMKSTNIQYNRVSERVLKELEDIVGSDNISTREEELICYSRDSTLFTHRPEVVIRPKTTEAVSGILRLANQKRIPVTPRGAGTSASGGPLPVMGGILLDMSAMDRILNIDIDNQMVMVESGVICDFLNERLMKDSFFFPPDPASSSACTIGGMVNTNAAGNRTIKYGPTSNFVLWMEVVLPNGDVVNTGSQTLKSVSGYDLTRLIVGSEGSLGVVTKIALKVVPVPKNYATANFVYESVEALARATTRLRRAGLVPEMIEFLDRKTAKASFEYAGLKDLPEGNFLLVDFGGEKEAIANMLEDAVDLCNREGPEHYEKTLDESYRSQLIVARKAALPALARLRPSTVMEDCTVPPTKLPEAARKVEQIPDQLATEGLDLGNFGHVGDGNMHPTFIFDERVDEQRKAFFRGLDILYKEIILPMGGSLTAEHGIGLIRAPYIDLEHPSSIGLMREIKRLFDPNFILNPGKGTGGPYPMGGTDGD